MTKSVAELLKITMQRDHQFKYFLHFDATLLTILLASIAIVNILGEEHIYHNQTPRS